jgi:hypothetical protein
MAHYAFLDENNFVTEVITGKNEDEMVEGIANWEDYYGALRNQTCKKTSYNTIGGVHYVGVNQPSTDQTKAFRKNYAGIGYYYDETRDAFIPPKPYASWVLNELSCWWEAPEPCPSDGKKYDWDEISGSWVEII